MLASCVLHATLVSSNAGAAVERDDASAVSIRQTADPGQGPCATPLVALSNTVASDADSFTLVVRSSAPLCTPLQATAAVYEMPGDGVAWPQRLAEAVPFTISAAGTTTIEFTKPCTAVQFDVVTGAVPELISPLGEHHGPLLFPFDLRTSEQWWGLGPRCIAPEPVVPEAPIVPAFAAVAAVVALAASGVAARRRRA